MTYDIEHIAGERDPWSDRLSEYLDGELSGSERNAIEAHLTTCGACTALLAELGQVVERARTLEDPPLREDLWPGIEARLTPRAPRAEGRSGRILGPGAWWGRRFELSLPQLAAAGLLLVAFSGGLAWLASRAPQAPGAVPAREPSRFEQPRVAANAPESSATPTGLAPVVAASTTPATFAALRNPGYDAAVAELERALAEGQGRLDPRTLRVIEQNLRVIDRALDEARRAVADDPGNAWLRQHLAATMKRKVDLLRSVTLLASAQG